MNRSMTNQDYADLFQRDNQPWRENNYKIDFSQFLAIMKWISSHLSERTI